jgi:pyruvate/oxaloacetate carboxyltransferase
MKHRIQIPGSTGQHAIARRLVAIIVSAVALSACASAPVPPTAALQAAELAIANAEEARIADYSSPELGKARENLTAARAAAGKEEMVLAQHLAEQSRADAELASAKAEMAKAKAVNDEMRKSTETLKQEMQRNPGVQ